MDTKTSSNKYRGGYKTQHWRVSCIEKWRGKNDIRTNSTENMHCSGIFLLLSSMICKTSIKPNTEPSLKSTGPGYMYIIVCYSAQEVREMPSLCRGQERFSNWSSGATRGLVRACGLLEVTLLQQQRGIQQEDRARKELSLVKRSVDEVRKTIAKDSRDTGVPTQKN